MSTTWNSNFGVHNKCLLEYMPIGLSNIDSCFSTITVALSSCNRNHISLPFGKLQITVIHLSLNSIILFYYYQHRSIMLKQKRWEKYASFSQKRKCLTWWSSADELFCYQVDGNAVCLLCNSTIAVLIEDNICQHYQSKHLSHNF